MKAIVSVGPYHFACPIATGSKLVELIGKCDAVEWADGGNYRQAVRHERGQIEMRLVQDHQVLPAKALKRIPEKAGPDCHGSMLPIS